jgi:hypothetical protein
MDKKYMDFICSLHGYCIRVKEIHWSTDNNAEHLLCDEIEEAIHDLEDRFAECAMGMTGKKVKVGDLKPMLPHATKLKEMLKELADETMDMKDNLDGYQYSGLENICDDIMEMCGKYMYRTTQR